MAPLVEATDDEPSTKRPRLEALLAPRHGCQILVLDGGLATHLEALGEDIMSSSLWSAKCLVENPEVIKTAHKDYYEAGADVAITASYQAHLEGFRELGVRDLDAVDAMKRSVTLARAAAPSGAKVAGSLGPYGASLHNGAEYTGDYPGMDDEEKLLEWHRPRATALKEAGCDFFACETIPNLVEAKALRRLLEELQHPGWITFSCKSESEVSSGELLRDCLAAIADCELLLGAGLNCTHPKFCESLIKICREVLPASKHVVVYPNSGEVYCGETHQWVSGTAASDQNFVTMAREWQKLGATCIGGCCRTSPATIKALRQAFSSCAGATVT